MANGSSATVSRSTGRITLEACTIRSNERPSTPGAACGRAATSSRGYIGPASERAAARPDVRTTRTRILKRRGRLDRSADSRFPSRPGATRHLGRCCLVEKFLVQPATPVMSPPNLSVHKPTGNCASRHNDCPLMPSRCPCRALVQFKYLDVEGCEADGCHRDLLGSIDLREGFLLNECPATVVNKVPVFGQICGHCDNFAACPSRPPRLPGMGGSKTCDS